MGPDLMPQAARFGWISTTLTAYGQSRQMSEDVWLNPLPIGQRTLYAGNSVVRGGRDPLIAEPTPGGPWTRWKSRN